MSPCSVNWSFILFDITLASIVAICTSWCHPECKLVLYSLWYHPSKYSGHLYQLVSPCSVNWSFILFDITLASIVAICTSWCHPECKLVLYSLWYHPSKYSGHLYQLVSPCSVNWSFILFDITLASIVAICTSWCHPECKLVLYSLWYHPSKYSGHLYQLVSPCSVNWSFILFDITLASIVAICTSWCHPVV